MVFLGANFDAVESVSGSLGVVSSKTLNYGAGNFARGMETLASATTMYSTMDCAINFSDADKLKVSTSISKAA